MTRRLKIVQLLPQLNSGGDERGTLEINRALVAEGHESLVVSGGGRMTEQLEAEGGRHIRMQIWRKSPLTLTRVRRLRRLIIEEKPDLLHVRSRIPAWVTWLAWKRLPVDARPVLLSTAHGMNKPNSYSRIMVRTEHVIAVSETCRDYLLKSYPDLSADRITVIHRGVSPEEFPYGYQASPSWVEQWYRTYPELRGRFVVCVPGRVTRFKGHPDFLDALALVRAKNPNAHGLIAGGEDPRRKRYSRELRERIRSLGLEGHVTFTGHRTDVRDVLSVSDVVVSTSVQPPESFGRAVLESVRLGRITLGYAHGGVGEVLSTVYPEGRVTLRDIRGLADGIEAAAAGRLNPPAPNTHFLLSTMQEKELALYGRLYSEDAGRTRVRTAA